MRRPDLTHIARPVVSSAGNIGTRGCGGSYKVNDFTVGWYESKSKIYWLQPACVQWLCLYVYNFQMAWFYPLLYIQTLAQFSFHVELNSGELNSEWRCLHRLRIRIDFLILASASHERFTFLNAQIHILKKGSSNKVVFIFYNMFLLRSTYFIFVYSTNS